MSSQLATPLSGGLPDHSSPPPGLHVFADSTWSDHMNLDRQTPNLDSAFSLSNESVARHDRAPSSSNVDSSQQRQAVGNLLAALNPISPPRPAEANRVETPDDKEELPQIPVPAMSQSDATPANATSEEQLFGVPEPDAPDGFSPLSTTAPDQSSELPIATETLSRPAMDLLPMASAALHQSTLDSIAPLPPYIPDRREVEAFAKIEFEDGNYYITTWACELGRDALAYKAALERAEEVKDSSHGHAQSSSGRVSRPSDRVRRPGDSQVQGSVVSEAGGFGGVDDDPHVRDGEKKSATGERSLSSQVSASDVVKPQEVLHNPTLIPFDYHRNAERQAHMDPDNEEPAPVTADHLPKADTCPLIPIHATTNSTKSEVATHKGISRRHIRIEWDFDHEWFQMKVLGRNGAFLDGNYVPRGVSKRLSSGSKIQISDIQMTFRLPRPKMEAPSDDSEGEEGDRSLVDRRSTSQTSHDLDESAPSRRGGKSKSTISYANVKSGSTLPDPLIGPDGLPIPPRKRGPGRPPKDGIMSTRERREREKAQRLAEAKAANGGKTPPPMIRGKFPKTPAPEDVPKNDAKPEKRKYKKRKRPGEDGDVLPSIEGGDMDIVSDTDKGPAKKARASKSPSPEYPPQESLSEEQLARPSDPYARLIYDILAEIHPKALPLKQIYRALKMKYPFFVYRVDSEGWQSSVRHNLNQEWNKLFEKGEKEGKGFAWKAIPGALQPQAERKRAAQAAAAAKPKPQTAPRTQPPPQGPAPPLNWQNSTPFPPNGLPRGPPPPFWQQGPPGSFPPTPNGMPWPPLPGSVPPRPGAPPMPQGQNPPPLYPPQPPGPQARPPPPPQASPVQQSSSTSAPHTPQPPTAQRPTSSQQTPAPHQPPSVSGSAAPNMPCTLDGLMAIKRFETAMLEQVKEGGPQGLAYWQNIFASVKNRQLHGAPESNMPGGESKEETTIMQHVRAFIEKFKNPNFVGFSGTQNQSQSRTVSPERDQSRNHGARLPLNDATPLAVSGEPLQISETQEVEEEDGKLFDSSKGSEKTAVPNSDSPAD